MSEIDIENKYFYEYDKPEKNERTKKRLTTISEMGMKEVGDGQFGVPGVMSGLYIEMVWSLSDKDFDDYIDWAEDVIKNQPNRQSIDFVGGMINNKMK